MIVKPLNVHRDHRGFLFELFSDNPNIKMSYVTVTHPRNYRGETEWHWHVNKTEHFVVVGGSMTLAHKDCNGYVSQTRLDYMEPRMVTIFPGDRHAFMTTSSIPATLICLTDQSEYMPEDEYRESMGDWSWNMI